MLSECKSMNKTAWAFVYPQLENPMTVRIKFIKIGKLQYISHLDLQRTFNRIIKRAGLPVWFTKGFNPHAKLVFSTPLSVGTQSLCEYLDLRMDRDVPCDILLQRLRAEVTEELNILDVYVPKTKFSEIAFAAYDYEICAPDLNEEIANKVTSLLRTAPLMMTKKTKSGEKLTDIIPLIHSVSASLDGSVLRMHAILCAEASSFLNPEMLITAMREHLHLLQGDPMTEYYSITRTQILRADLTSFH